MDLYIFPEGACLNNGYGIGVDFAYRKLKPKKDDLIVWYTILEEKDMLYLRKEDVVIKKNSFYSIKSIKNILMGKDRTELSYSQLSFLEGCKFEHIHCDEVIFYRALRKMFPKQKMSLRLHNCFSRIYDRQRMLEQTIDWKYMTKLKNMYKLEREIFQDKNIFKIFISDEDRDYYRTTFGRYNDSETWAYIPDMEQALLNRKLINFNHKLVWFGGIESHKKAAIDWFIKNILPEVRQVVPDVEFHLWGRGSLVFNDELNNVYGHGFFDGDGMPLSGSLYINPDIIGGGIKLKLQTLIENGVPFISSVFGYEGYSKDLIDNQYIIVKEEDDWAECIINLIK
ncbi:MAG: hypothetical protein UEP29_04985 [Phocaeicola massiliensis]|jgi:hypothetical protein|nr:hypothetical protein [Phocaeicola massiliensis]